MTRIYSCPEHPTKLYTSWRKFRGHWSTQHRGEECPPREEFLQEVEKPEVEKLEEELKEQRKEAREEKLGEKEPQYGKDVPVIGEGGLPEDPVQRLATILDVHGVEKSYRDQILGIFQLHPAYKENPVNIHYLLTAKLPRKFHSSIPMMVNEFAASEMGYPEGGAIGMMQMGMGGVPMPPYMYGQQSPYGYAPYMAPQFVRQPIIGGRESPDEERIERGKRREERSPVEDAVTLLGAILELKDRLMPEKKEDESTSKVSPIGDAVALLGTLMELRDKLAPQKGEGESSVKEIFEGFRTTIEEMEENSRGQQQKLLGEMKQMEEGHRQSLESIKETLHDAEKARLQDKIDTLTETKEEERSEGLGTLLREAGEGLGVQMQGVRTSLDQAAAKLGDVAEKTITARPSGGLIIRGSEKSATGSRTITEASELMEAEAEVERLAKKLGG